jgi:hypothetical protein
MADKYRLGIGDQVLEVTLEKIADDAADDDVVITASGNRDAAGNVILPYRPRSDNTIVMSLNPEAVINQNLNVRVQINPKNEGDITMFGNGLQMFMVNAKTRYPDGVPIPANKVVGIVVSSTQMDSISDVGVYLYRVTDWLNSLSLTYGQQIQDDTYLCMKVGDNIKADKFYISPASGSKYVVNGVEYG